MSELRRLKPNDADDTPSVVREAWRAQLFEDLAQKSAQRRHAAAVRQAMLVGALIGIFASVAIYLP